MIIIDSFSFELASDKNSHIFKHLRKNFGCKNNASPNRFKIVDSDKSFLKFKIKEGFYITREKPELSVQVKHFKTSFKSSSINMSYFNETHCY